MLRRWRASNFPSCQYFFTCARPGRTGNAASRYAQVPDDLVRRWVLGLPGPNTSIVSLLGSKHGISEFSFYSFYGGFDLPSENPGCLSFREWLIHWYGDRSIVLCEHPTCDFEPIVPETLDAIVSDMGKLLSEGRTVVLIDSGGQQRTGAVCHKMRAVEDSSQSM